MNPPSSTWLCFQIAKHELLIILKTRRAFAAAGLYLATALLGSFAYIYSLREIEKALTTNLVELGSDPLSAAATAGLMGSQAYEKTLSFFVGSDIELIANIFTSSPLLPPCLWGSLAFLPLLILITSFDQSVNDIHSRSLCYSLLRISRQHAILGKAMAHTLLFMGLTALCFTVLIVIAAIQLESLEFGSTLLGFVRIWLMILPFGLFYISVTSLASTIAKTPFAALGLSIGLFFVLKVFGWFQAISPNSSYGFLRHLRWLSPSHYVSGFWLKNPMEPLLSCGAFAGLSLCFLLFAINRLESRDL